MPLWWTWPGSGIEDPNPSAMPMRTCASGICRATRSPAPRPFWNAMTTLSGSSSGGDGGTDLLDVLRLGGDHPHVAGAGVGRARTDVEVVDHERAAGAGDREAAAGDGVDVLRPGVDRPHLVPGLAEQGGVHRAHGARPDDRDLHRCHPLSIAPRARTARIREAPHRDPQQPVPRRHHPRGAAHAVCDGAGPRARRQGSRSSRARAAARCPTPSSTGRSAASPAGSSPPAWRRARCWRSWRRTSPSTRWCSTASPSPAGSSRRSTRPTPMARCTTSSSTPAQPDSSPSALFLETAMKAIEGTAVKEVFVLGDIPEGAVACARSPTARRSARRAGARRPATTWWCCPTRRAPPACPRA